MGYEKAEKALFHTSEENDNASAGQSPQQWQGPEEKGHRDHWDLKSIEANMLCWELSSNTSGSD